MKQYRNKRDWRILKVCETFLVLLHVTLNISHCSWTKWQQQQPLCTGTFAYPVQPPTGSTGSLNLSVLWETCFWKPVAPKTYLQCVEQAPRLLLGMQPDVLWKLRAPKHAVGKFSWETSVGDTDTSWRVMWGLSNKPSVKTCLLGCLLTKLAFSSVHQKHFLKAALTTKKTASESINRNRSGSSSQRNQFLAQGHFVHFAISPTWRSVNYLGF